MSTPAARPFPEGRQICREPGRAEQLQQAGRDPVHDPHEFRNEGRRGPVIQLIGSRYLLQPAIVHDADPVRHGQGLFLVMRDEQRGGAQPLLQGADLLTQLQPDLGVQRGQRLVEEQDPGLDGQRPGQRHPLLLAAGQLVRVLLALGGQADHVEQAGGPPLPLGGAEPAHPQPEAHVVQRRHVWEKAVALEHHAHVPLGRGHRGHVPAVHLHRARVGGLEASHDAQRGGLPAPGGSEQGYQFPGSEIQVQPVQGPGRAEGPGQVLQPDGGPGGGLRASVRLVASGPARVRRHQDPPVGVLRLTENSETSAPPFLRDPRPPIMVIASRKIQVTNSASSEAATEIGPLV